MIGETLLSSAQVQPVLSADPELISVGCFLSSFAKECALDHQPQSLDQTFKPADGRETVPSITFMR